MDRDNTAVRQNPDSLAIPVGSKTLNCWYFTSSNPDCRAPLPSQNDTFVLPALYMYVNAGRNILRGDRLVQLDMSLFKNFRITESNGFQAQVFNPTNNASFAAPNNTVNLATDGQVTAPRNQPRLYEFGLKFYF